MDEYYLGDIILYAGKTIPKGFSLCNGSLLKVSENGPLFALLNTTYGGDGKTNFALPDLRGAVPVGTGKNKASGTKYNLGVAGGAATAQISQDNLPAHTHEATMPPLAATLNINKAVGTKATPDAGDSLAMGIIPATQIRGSVQVAVSMYSTNTPTFSLNSASIQVSAPQITVANTGNSKPIDIMQPYIAMNYIIATDGSFPSRPL
jgi:microcystin-dependent protein